MPHDFGSFGSQDRRSGSGIGSGIGFHELRQACEISNLREDLERLAHEAGTLRDSVEEAVEQIRDRFAALSPAELTDATAMAPLLQFAVTTLLDIREQTRRLNTRTGPVADDDRSTWLGAADAPRVRPNQPQPQPQSAAPCAPAAVPPPPPQLTREPLPMAVPAPQTPAAAAPIQEVPAHEDFGRESRPAAASPPSQSPPAAPFSASWLTSKSAPPPPPSRAAVARNAGPPTTPPGGIDWLSPAGR